MNPKLKQRSFELEVALRALVEDVFNPNKISLELISPPVQKAWIEYYVESWEIFRILGSDPQSYADMMAV